MSKLILYSFGFALSLQPKKWKQKSMQRYFIYLAYDGTAYHGWQIQPNGDSVQECLMRALATLMRREVEVIGAGRTDAGVHALSLIHI